MTRRFVVVIGVVLLMTNAAHAACSTVKGVLTITSIFSLSSTFDPTPGSNYQSPICSNPAPKGLADKIQAAFLRAPPGLQRDLCSLTCIFVGAGQPNGSWGKWEDINATSVGANMGSGDSFIAIHNADLDMRLNKKHDANLGALNSSVAAFASHTDPENDLNSKSLSLMYTLAHEMAHIKWRQAISIGGQQLSANCTVDQFINNGSWSDAQNVQQKRWLDFTSDIGQRNNGVKAPSAAATDQELADIYTKGMVTILGDLNAAEDFVEAYSIQALRLAGTTLDIGIRAHGTKNVTSDTRGDSGGDAILKVKFNCVLPLLTP